MDPLRTCTAWRGNSDCLACDGREHALFAGLPEEAIERLHVDVGNIAVPAGATLYRAGDVADHLWVMRTGVVKLVSLSRDGETRIVRVLKAGDIAGIEGLLAQSFTHSAVAVGEVRVCRTPVPAVRELCLEHAGFQWNLMLKLQAALHESEQWLLDATTSKASARVRMARLLLRLRDGETNRIYNFPREDLGLMLGIAVETASRIIAGFVRDKLLVRRYLPKRDPSGRGRYYDSDIRGLEKIAEGGV